jgi:hypothetical protein
MKHRALALATLVFVVGCKKAATVDDKPLPGSGSGSATAPRPVPDNPVAKAPAWKIESQPIALPCGDRPLKLPPPAAATKPAVDRVLAHADAMTVCQDQASVAAACTCLAGAVDKWAGGLSAPAECEVQTQADPRAQLVMVSSNPADGASKSGGSAFILVARHGAMWSAAGVVELAPDVDLAETPKASRRATVTKLEPHPLAAATLYWIESQSETQERSMGDLDRDGAAQGTICVAPNAGTAAPFCYKPISLGAWTYSFTPAKADAPDACTIQGATAFGVGLDATSATVRLLHGSDSEGMAGRYRLE